METATVVVYRSNKYNVRIEVKGAASESKTPAAALHPDVKMAEFRDGVLSTDDPEIIAFLDARPDLCWRMDEAGADLKAKFGPEEYERLRKQFAAVPDES